jgi:hypothetical protein
MIPLSVSYLRFGDLLLKRCPDAAFEVIHLLEEGRGAAVARVSMAHEEAPRLVVTRLDHEPRAIERAPTHAAERVLLCDCRSGDPACYRLSAEFTGGRLAVTLAGDSRFEHGRHHFRLFWWRAEFRVADGDVIVTGPSLAADSYS